jgi:hypothetical protein
MKHRQGSIDGKPRCPTCERILDGFTAINGDRDPEPGDFSICLYCATPLRWDGFAYCRLIGSALVLARLNDAFLRAEAVARAYRDERS